MAIYSNLPVFKDVYRLLLDVQKTAPHISRDVRYTIVSQLSSQLMDILQSIYDANAVRQKMSILKAMRRAVVSVKVQMRLLVDMHSISERKYTEWIEQAEQVSKQLTAWEKSEQQKTASVATTPII